MRRLSGLWWLAAASVGLLALCGAVSAQTPEVYIRVRNTATGALTEARLDANSPAPRGRLPVLFVHGHNLVSSTDLNRNYKNNWQDALDELPSFMDTLDLADNDWLDVEDYYIRFRQQNRPITDDAADIHAAVELILRRHDASYPTNPTTDVQVVIIAYSKGTISSRLYLKNLEAEHRGFRPVSEFIAIAPPNHGLSSAIGSDNSCALQQLLDGYDENCNAVAPAPSCTPVQEFFTALNGRPTTTLDENASNPDEAPGSRADVGADGTPRPPVEGTLYVTLFAHNNRDLVGGDTASGDCRGRRLAKNLSPDAVNIPVPEVSDVSHNLLVSEGSPVAVHQNTVHTPEVICQALYAAAHHRSPRGQTCMLVEGKPVIPRAAALLALDFSGSMSSSLCPGCAQTRADELKDSVELFVQLWRAQGVPSDRLGVTYFRTDVLGGESLPFLGDPANDVGVDVRRQAPGGLTAMGGGLQRAIDTLRTGPAPHLRRVILFTDGMQNLNPMVMRTADGGLVIDNETGRQNSNISPASPPTRLDESLGVAVDTIGVGAGEAFVGLLSDIAGRTGGRAAVTTAPDQELRRLFVEELINALRGFSPQLVAYRRGAVAGKGVTEAFDIEDGARKLIFKVSWKRGDSLDFTVAREGVDVTSAGRFVAGEFYKIFVVDSPPGARGNWQLRINGKASTPYEAAAIVDGGQIEYDAAFGSPRPRAGEPLDLVVRLTAGGRPVGGARVNVTLKSPTAAAGDIIAGTRLKELPPTEPAMTVGERQVLALLQDRRRRAALKERQEKLALQPNDKGEFRTRLSPQVPGVYTALITIEADDTRLGRFSRTLTATVVVRFAASELKEDDVFTSECNVGGRRYVRLILSPRDARGRRMGPGFSSDISARLSAGRTVGGVQDLGGGNYMLVLQVSPGDDPTLTLEAAGGALFSGRLSRLSGSRR